MSSLTTTRTLPRRQSFVQLWLQEWGRLIAWYPARDPFLVLPAVVWLLLLSQWQEALCFPLLAGYARMHQQMHANLKGTQ